MSNLVQNVGKLIVPLANGGKLSLKLLSNILSILPMDCQGVYINIIISNLDQLIQNSEGMRIIQKIINFYV